MAHPSARIAGVMTRGKQLFVQGGYLPLFARFCEITGCLCLGELALKGGSPQWGTKVLSDLRRLGRDPCVKQLPNFKILQISKFSYGTEEDKCRGVNFCHKKKTTHKQKPYHLHCNFIIQNHFNMKNL